MAAIKQNSPSCPISTSLSLKKQAQIEFCPVLYPSEKEFQNFYAYITDAEAKYSSQYGMVKIVPPPGWNPHDHSYQQIKQQMKVKKPIEQHAKMSKNDYYEIRNIIQESMELRKFQKKIGDKLSTQETEPEKLEKMFWKTVKYTPPIYGADLHKSLMCPRAGAWNLANLDSLLTDAVPDLVRGVTYPYVYVGTWKSIFCWHKEDLDLAAINYLHEGKQKIWYCIQSDDQQILEAEAREAFPDNYASCPRFMRHKTTLINPYKLKQKHPNLKINKAYQSQNQFVVAFGGAYHCGFNSGKNIAEAVNFATKDWLKRLQGVSFCQCTPRSVRPDYKYFIDNLERKNSRFKNDPELKSLKDWVIDNGFYNETALDEQPAEFETSHQKPRRTKQKEKRQDALKEKGKKKGKKISKKNYEGKRNNNRARKKQSKRSPTNSSSQIVIIKNRRKKQRT